MQKNENAPNGSRKEKSKRSRMYAGAGLVLGAILLWLILWAYYPGPAVWTGFGDFTDPDGDFIRRKTLWDWLELLIIPLVLGIGALIFNKSERESERRSIDARAELERELNRENQREAALQSYLDRMAELLLKEKLKTTESEEVRDVARIRTLTVVRALDPKRKGMVVRFLKEAGLIEGKAIIGLQDADLSQADLVAADLFGTDLRAADLSGAHLRWANLGEADLSKASLLEANLYGAKLNRANLNEASLYYARLANADLSGANLNNADLSYARYDSKTKWPEGFDPRAAGTVLVDDDF